MSLTSKLAEMMGESDEVVRALKPPINVRELGDLAWSVRQYLVDLLHGDSDRFSVTENLAGRRIDREERARVAKEGRYPGDEIDSQKEPLRHVSRLYYSLPPPQKEK
jgi:hypothetical protein